MDMDRIFHRWKEASKRIEKQYPEVNREVFNLPVQCLSVFIENYFKKNDEDIIGPGIPFEIPISSKIIVTGNYPLLTKTPYGARITIFTFEPKARPELFHANDFINTIYSHAYRTEFGKKEFCITVHNLGDGHQYDIIHNIKMYQKHLALLENLGNLVYNEYKVPALENCNSCPIAGPCHLRQYSEHI